MNGDEKSGIGTVDYCDLGGVSCNTNPGQDQSLSKAGNESPPRLGSPDQVDNLIEADESSI
jgi:hypothetical protein